MSSSGHLELSSDTIEALQPIYMILRLSPTSPDSSPSIVYENAVNIYVHYKH